MPANLVFRRKIWGARDKGIPPRSTPDTSEGLLICFAREYYYTSCFLPVFAITVIAGELVKVFTWRPVIWVLELEDREKVFTWRPVIWVLELEDREKVFTWRPVIWVLELEDREKVFVFEAGVKVFVVVCIAKVFALGHRVNIFVLGGM